MGAVSLFRSSWTLARRVELREVHTDLSSCSILSPLLSPRFPGLEKAGFPGYLCHIPSPRMGVEQNSTPSGLELKEAKEI